MKLYVPQCFLAFREWTVGEGAGKRGAAQRTFSGIEFSACRTCTGSLPAASSSSAEYVVNVYLTSSRRSSQGERKRVLCG